MRGKTALIGFLVLQGAMLVFWIASLAPLLGSGAPLVSDANQIWSGGAFSTTTGSFRGDTGVAAARFELFGYMLWGALLIAASGAMAWFAGGAFHRNRIWLSAILSVLSLGLAAGGAYYIVTQWSGDTSFAPPMLDMTLLYMITRTAMIQLFIGWVLVAIYTVLAIADVSNPGKPLGYHLVELNWIIVAIVWIVVYLAAYLAPHQLGGG
jgi:hypothetical protein